VSEYRIEESNKSRVAGIMATAKNTNATESTEISFFPGVALSGFPRYRVVGLMCQNPGWFSA
jgi:hypothetical protein